MLKPIGAVVVGTGFIGPVHVEALRRANVDVVGIVPSPREDAGTAAERLGVRKGFRTLGEALQDPEVGAVHLATPNRLHFEMAKDVLEAGKHLVCEKPLAMNSRESAELLRLSRSSRVTTAVNYNIRYYPLCMEAKARVSAGEVGDIFSIAGSYVQDWLLYPTDYNWRVRAEEGGELRAVADIGTHWMDLLLHITGLEVEAVMADLATFHPVRSRPMGEVQTFTGSGNAEVAREVVDVTTEDHGSILLRFRGGAKGVLWVSQVTAGQKNALRFEIAGSKHALAWESQRPNELWIGHRDGPNQNLVRDPALLSPSVRRYTNYPGGHNEGFPDTFKQLYRDFYGYIERGDFSAPPTFPTFADGHREILLCEAILQSHRDQQWVTLPGGNL